MTLKILLLKQPCSLCSNRRKSHILSWAWGLYRRIYTVICTQYFRIGGKITRYVSWNIHPSECATLFIGAPSSCVAVFISYWPIHACIYSKLKQNTYAVLQSRSKLWQDVVTRSRSVKICEIIVHLLVIVQNTK